jgi:hypothetical protein
VSGGRRVAQLVALALALLCTSGGIVRASEAQPYLGAWSNGRGETLAITATTVRFAEDKPVPYRDVTRATDGTLFELQLTAAGEVNGFGGKTLVLELEDDALKITAYASHGDSMQEKDPQSVVTWYREAKE